MAPGEQACEETGAAQRWLFSRPWPARELQPFGQVTTGAAGMQEALEGWGVEESEKNDLTWSRGWFWVNAGNISAVLTLVV